MYTSATVFINFECKYETFYEDIEATQIEIDNDEVYAGTSADGKFDFSLTRYVDANFTAPANSSSLGLGKNLFFRLSMESPTPQMVYSLIGKKKF